LAWYPLSGSAVSEMGGVGCTRLQHYSLSLQDVFLTLLASQIVKCRSQDVY